MLLGVSLKDLAILLAVYIYVLCTIGVGELIRRRGKHPGITRKMIHFLAGDAIIILPMFSSPIWPALIPIGLGLVVALAFTFLKKSPITTAMIEPGDAAVHAYGPVYYIISILILVLAFWEWKLPAMAATFIMAWGDGAATLVAKRFRKRHVFPWGDKSLEGSLGMLLFSLAGSLLSLAACIAFGVQIPPVDGLVACIVGSLVGTLVEAVTVGAMRPFDNFTVPLASALAIWFLIR